MRYSSTVGLPTWISYGEFGERFVAHAVTPARIEAAVSDLARAGIQLGPRAVGPGKLAKLTVRGDVGRAVITPREGSRVAFAVQIPVRLELTIQLGGRRLVLATSTDIDLTLRARTAEPLLVVIDIPSITQRNVSAPVISDEADDGELAALLSPMETLVRREVASRFNAMLASSQARRSRVVDIEAIVAGVPSRHDDLTTFDWIDYAEFGRRFLPRIVTQAQVLAVAESFSGQVVEAGPLRTGPRDTVEVVAKGEIGTPRVARRTGEDTIAFEMVVPLTLDIVVTMRKANRYCAEVEIPLVLVARTAAPLAIVIDVDKPDTTQIIVRLRAEGVRARTVGVLSRMRRQIAEQVSVMVSSHLADPSLRTVDVAARLDAARFHSFDKPGEVAHIL